MGTTRFPFLPAMMYQQPRMLGHFPSQGFNPPAAARGPLGTAQGPPGAMQHQGFFPHASYSTLPSGAVVDSTEGKPRQGKQGTFVRSLASSDIYEFMYACTEGEQEPAR